MATLSRNSQRTEWGGKTNYLPNGQRDQTLRSGGQGFNGENVGRQFENFGSPRNEKGEKINGDRNRSDIRKHLENLARTARERTQGFISRIREFANRKRPDHSAIQRNQQAIRDIAGFNQQVEKVIEQRQKQRSKGMSL